MAVREHSWRLTLLLVAVCVTVAARTQQTPPGSLTSENAAVNRTLVSPEVLPDGKVIVRIHAPKASEVLVGGDWLQPPPPLPLAKNEQGVWSTTMGPLASDYYLYLFRVDGVMTPDPNNPEVKPGAFGSPQNILFIPGADTDFMENKNVPHGEVRQVWYRSSIRDVQRRMHLYTPPGYDITCSRYPVLYLLHGGGESDSSWSAVGRAGFIMDNLLAAQKATAMVVVMPEVPLPRARDRFDEELLKDIVPYVEEHYRVRPERDSRALAGYSVGGYQTLQMLTAHPEAFAPTASFALCVEDAEDLEARKLYQVLPDREAAREGYLRVVDESGEDYIYPSELFVTVRLPAAVLRRLRGSARRRQDTARSRSAKNDRNFDPK